MRVKNTQFVYESKCFCLFQYAHVRRLSFMKQSSILVKTNDEVGFSSLHKISGNVWALEKASHTMMRSQVHSFTLRIQQTQSDQLCGHIKLSHVSAQYSLHKISVSIKCTSVITKKFIRTSSHASFFYALVCFQLQHIKH